MERVSRWIVVKADVAVVGRTFAGSSNGAWFLEQVEVERQIG
jgi:hypothetical protein